MKLSEISHRLIAEEIKKNPIFGRKVRAMIASPDGDHLLSVSAKKAVANEFNPKLYPESRGEWVTLRRTMTELARSVPGMVKAEIDRMPFEAKMAVVRAIAEGQRPEIAVEMDGLGELGQDIDLTPLIGAIAGAGASVYSSYVTSSAQRDIEKIRAESAAQQTQLQLQIARATQAVRATQEAQDAAGYVPPAATTPTATPPSTDSGVISTLTQPVVAGIPLWAFPVGLGVLGLVYFIIRRK